MNMDEIQPVKDEIKRVLGDKIDDATLENELHKYLDEYHISLDAAKRGIIRKYGDTNTSSLVSGLAITKKINELTGNETSVDIVAKVLSVANKDIKVKNIQKTIVEGYIGDETGTTKFTIWEPGQILLEKGSVYTFKGLYAKTWNDRISVNLGNRGSVVPMQGVEIDVPEREYAPSTECKICDIRDGMGSVTVTGRILSAETRDVMVKGEPKVVYSGILADSTGKIQYSAWSDHGLHEGDTVNIKDAYIRAWKGIPQLNIGDRCTITKTDEKIDVSTNTNNKKTVAEIEKIGGGLDITVEGLVVDVKTGSGLIKRCPQCRRTLTNGVCTTHGAVAAVNDLRLKVVIDDGTGAIGAVFNKDDTEKLTGISMTAAENLAEVQGEGAVMIELTSKILMKRVSVNGNAMSDDFGPSMIVKQVSETNIDVVKEANNILSEIEKVI